MQERTIISAVSQIRASAIRDGKPGRSEAEALLLKAELKRQGVTYAGLVDRLEAIGISEKEVNVRNKLSPW